jgi:DNA-binding response OmpR family regulator
MMDIEQSTRVALLYHGRSHRHKVQQIVNQIADEAIAVDLHTTSESLCEAVADCDLIIVEALGYTTVLQQRALESIRSSSLAPVVVLINKQHPDHTVDAIASGADAVISLELAHDAIVAHCRALMRRWRAHPYATPKFS